MNYKLSEIMELIGGGTPKTSIPDYWNGDIPWLSVKDFNNESRYVYKTEKSITKMGLENSSTKLLSKDDTIISARGTVGAIAMIPFPMAFNQFCYGLRAKAKIVDSVFLYYLIKHNVYILKKNTHGSVFDTITRDTFDRIEVDIPHIELQKKIASVLSLIDDKIELNNKINDNLMQQGTSLFNEYLVKFDDVPNNWKVSSLDRIADYINGLTMQKYPQKDNEEGLPVLKIAELKQGCCDSNSDRCTSQLDEDYIINDGDVIFSWSASLVVDLWCGGKAGLNQHLFNVKSNIYDKWFYFWWTKYHLNEFIHEASSKATTMGHIKRDNLSKAKVLIPSKNDYESIGHLLKPITDSIVNVKLENKRLSALRDSLLPKLMSGEIDVDSIEL